MDLDLDQRTALVTGASMGIGQGIARVLASEGVRVAITARRQDLLQRLADEIAATGAPRPEVIVGDITRADDVARIAREAQAALGRVDILINNAGGSRPTRVDASDEEWDEAMNLNFTALRRMTQALLPGMRERRWGRIINITGSMEPRTLNAAATAKGAVHLWAKGLACDLAAEGITVNSIPPGRIDSEQIRDRLHPTKESRREFIERNIPIGYFGQPEDIGHLATFLCSPLAGYITGNVIAVDGGMHVFAH